MGRGLALGNIPNTKIHLERGYRQDRLTKLGAQGWGEQGEQKGKMKGEDEQGGEVEMGESFLFKLPLCLSINFSDEDSEQYLSIGMNVSSWKEAWHWSN